MKRSLLMIAALLAGSMAYAQSQRLCLFEEFTQASCGPCAATNPALNTLLHSAANEGKIIAIKYQTSWPGTDPMNIQTQSWVGPRVTYYGVLGVPDGEMDGNVFNDHPGNFNQNHINSRYAVPSPFTMNLTHTVSADYDSIFINLDITCTQAVTTISAVKCRVALIEKEVSFCSAPGTNGEREFSEVMRKMFPDAAGTTVASSWTVGQTQTLTFAQPLPAYIYDKSQVSVVAFMQNDGNKEVYQASFSAPQPLVTDAGFKNCAAATVVSCEPTPTLTLYNYGSGTLTSCTINYQVDGGTVTTMPWTGSLAGGASTPITLTSVNLTAGSHIIHIFTTNPNGVTDYNAGNDVMNVTVTVLGTPFVAPIIESFTLSTYPPTGWTRENVDGDSYQWSRNSAGAGSSYMNWYNAAAGTVDNLYTPIVDFTATNMAAIEWDMAHAQYCYQGTCQYDELQLQVSTDCGLTWNTVWSKVDPALATVASQSAAFNPTLSSQWRHELVLLSQYTGQNILIRFHALSDYGNNLFIDRINIINNETDIATVSASNADVSVYPNPSNGEFNLNLNLDKVQDVTVTVTNAIGAVITTQDLKDVKAGMYPVNIAGQSKGNYLVSVKTGSTVINKTITITE